MCVQKLCIAQQKRNVKTRPTLIRGLDSGRVDVADNSDDDEVDRLHRIVHIFKPATFIDKLQVMYWFYVCLHNKSAMEIFHILCTKPNWIAQSCVSLTTTMAGSLRYNVTTQYISPQKLFSMISSQTL